MVLLRDAVRTFRLDTAESRWHSSPMTIILILAVALAGGVMIQSRWALLLPLAFGACVAVAIAATGRGLSDTRSRFLWWYPHWSCLEAKACGRVAVPKSFSKPGPTIRSSCESQLAVASVGRGTRLRQRPDDAPGNATGDRLTIRSERGLSGTTLPDLNRTTTVMGRSGEGFSSVAIRKATKTSRNRRARNTARFYCPSSSPCPATRLATSRSRLACRRQT